MLVEEIELAVGRIRVGLPIHALQPGLDDVPELVAERWVVGHHRGIGAREQLAVAVLVLQPLAVQGGPTGSRPENEAACHLVARRPEAVAGALETEHGVEDVDRNHRHVVGGVGGADGSEGGDRARLVDPFVQDLSGF